MAVMRAAAATALWEDRIHLYQFSLDPRPRLPVSSAEQSVLSKTGQTVRSPTLTSCVDHKDRNDMWPTAAFRDICRSTIYPFDGAPHPRGCR